MRNLHGSGAAPSHNERGYPPRRAWCWRTSPARPRGSETSFRYETVPEELYGDQMKRAAESRVCFVIAPIGEEDTEVRRRSDQVLNHIITPAVQQCGYESVRADKISEPGLITSQVIQHLLDDPLVVADLTGRNPNVFYELAIRHAIRKPVVQLIQIGEPIPFDVAQSRTVQVDHRDLDSAARCKEELVRQIGVAERNPGDVDTPISVAIDLQSLRQSENPLEKSNAEIMTMLQEIRAMVADPGRGRMHPGMFEEFMMFHERMSDVLDFPSDGDDEHPALSEARMLLHRMSRLVEMMAVESGMPMDFVEHMRMRRSKRGPRRK